MSTKKKPSNHLIFMLIVVGLWLLFKFLPWGGNSTPKTHEQKVKECFSSWDGSQPDIVRMVKAQLNDPESFKHLETTYLDKGEFILVIMKFTGKNGFGGRITKTATGQVNINCEVVGAPVIL